MAFAYSILQIDTKCEVLPFPACLYYRCQQVNVCYGDFFLAFVKACIFLLEHIVSLQDILYDVLVNFGS